MWNAIFLLCLFLIKIQDVLMVIILSGCNGNKTFVRILKFEMSKFFGYTHVDEIMCYEQPGV